QPEGDRRLYAGRDRALEQGGQGREREAAMSGGLLCDEREHALSRIHFHLAAIGNSGRYIVLKPGEHGQIGQCGALRQKRVHRVEHQRERYDAPRCHFVEHPRRRDATLGGMQDQYFPDIGLTSQLVAGTTEYSCYAVEIVARRETVLRHERVAAHRASHRLASAENAGGRDHVSLPLTAASTHCSIEASMGL